MCRMVIRVAACVSLLLICSALARPTASLAQGPEQGPEVRSFLQLMRHEEDELEFQIRHNEISRPHYLRARNRLAIQRQAVLDIVRATGEDVVPEIHVVTLAETDELIEDGAHALKTVKRGGIINGKWRYLGSVTRGETFYILERLNNRL